MAVVVFLIIIFVLSVLLIICANKSCELIPGTSGGYEVYKPSLYVGNVKVSFKEFMTSVESAMNAANALVRAAAPSTTTGVNPDGSAINMLQSLYGETEYVAIYMYAAYPLVVKKVSDTSVDVMTSEGAQRTNNSDNRTLGVNFAVTNGKLALVSPSLNISIRYEENISDLVKDS